MTFKTADILIPKTNDNKAWSVVACDQYTSEPEYWNEVEKLTQSQKLKKSTGKTSQKSLSDSVELQKQINSSGTLDPRVVTARTMKISQTNEKNIISPQKKRTSLLDSKNTKKKENEIETEEQEDASNTEFIEDIPVDI